mmetsp:Transcript_37291/g.67082  ORF Transcript_37291/g.67082 Transcript_37291/m.67082 type:complete len:169 (+) Transcript_37291:34-540(+)
MGYNTEDSKEMNGAQKYDVIDTNDVLAGDSWVQFEIDEPIPAGGCGSDEEQSEDTSNNITSKVPIESDKIEEHDRVNLNMCSAYTHVFADTLRSIAVIIASVIAQTVESVTPEVADATAAVIVSFIIFFSVLPLFRGLFHTWRELRSITLEELALSDNGPNDFEVEIN